MHLNRVISKYDLNMFYVAGPGHGGPALVANTYLEGSYSEIYPDISRDEPGMKKLFTQFSFPGGISSHVAPTTPGSIHEGGELGYSLSHAFGAAFDNPDLVVACVIGDGEAETGPLATAWHSNKFLNPVNDGAALPILHLNGYKISDPTVLARIEPDELDQFLRGCGWDPRHVEDDVSDDSTSVGLSSEELMSLLDVAEAHSPRWGALESLLAHNGVRIDEALAADVADYTYQRGHRVLRIIRKGGRTSTEPSRPPRCEPSTPTSTTITPWLARCSSTAPRPEVWPTRLPSPRFAAWPARLASQRPSRSRRTHCATPSSPRPRRRAYHCRTFRTRPATATPGPPGARTAAATTSTAIPPMSWRPTCAAATPGRPSHRRVAPPATLATLADVLMSR